MSSKYGSIRSDTWKWVHEKGHPRISEHVLYERWDQRTPPDSCSPEHAWTHGIDVSYMADAFADKHGEVPNKAVYWSEETEWGRYDIVLIACEKTVRTVLRVSSLHDESVERSLLALRELIEQ